MQKIATLPYCGQIKGNPIQGKVDGQTRDTLYKFQMQALEKENVYTMQASSANNMGHNFPLLQFPVAVPSPQIHQNSRQKNNFTGNNQANQPLSPSFPAAPMLLTSYLPFNVPQDGERN